MDLLKDDLGKLYRKFLIASFSSALIASIYGLVDMIVVGQYHGPDGAAAMSVIAPVWNIIYSFGLLTGIGGSVLYGVSKGKGSKKANLYFTSAVVFSAIISAVLWVIILVFEDKLLLLFGRITVNGFSSFIIDVAMGVLTMLFNRQIMKYLGTDALAVYGVIVSVSTLVQCCSYGIGQASQPIISQNYGAGNVGRIKKMLRYNIITAAIFGAVWAAITFAVPNGLIRLFMTPTASVLAIAPAIIRIYGSSFLLLSFNVYSTYYFQATMRAKTSMFVSVARGILISGALILIIPVTLGADMIWWAMPVTELVVAVFAGAMMAKKIQL